MEYTTFDLKEEDILSLSTNALCAENSISLLEYGLESNRDKKIDLIYLLVV